MKIFISGPRAISNLNKSVQERLYGIYEKNYAVLVGDANGVDKEVQNYFYLLNYANVIVYASNGNARNNIGKWPVEAVHVPGNIKGFDFYSAKDKAMADSADYGFMLWNGESKGTLNNIINLLNENKKALVFFSPHNLFVLIDSFEKLDMLLNFCNEETKKLFEKLYYNATCSQLQLSLF
jgi:hypothetical protein